MCVVCLDGEVQDGNEILLCDGCDMAAHQFCYGVPKLPGDGDWFCRQCEAKVPPETRCCICNRSDIGGMKPTECGRWAHIFCALHISETGFRNMEVVEPVVGVDLIDESRRKLPCSICKKRGGAIIQCHARSCAAAFHVPCCMADNAARAAALHVHPYNDDNPSEPYRRNFFGISTEAHQNTSIYLNENCDAWIFLCGRHTAAKKAGNLQLATGWMNKNRRNANTAATKGKGTGSPGGAGAGGTTAAAAVAAVAAAEAAAAGKGRVKGKRKG